MNNILVLFTCVAAVTCNDIRVGSVDHGRVIFDEKIQASPAIWRQVQKITINASDYEVISQVVVTDERPEKDGDVKIVEGGEGQKNVTIELQSPTVFRGFDFHVVVYAIQENVDGQQPILIAKDTDVNKSSKPQNEDSIDSVTPEDNKLAMPTVEEKPVKNDKGEPNAPVMTGDQTRKYRNTPEQSVVDPIVQYVSEQKTTEEPTQQKAITSEVTTVVNAQKTNAPVTTSPGLSFGNAKVNEAQTPQTDKDITDGVKVSSKDIPQIKDVKDLSTTTVYASTEASVKTSSSTEHSHDQTTEQNFDSISRELGQKVVLGIKKH